MNDLVSIIIPIYKVEQYLRQCIESVLSQKYTNIEVILVDDGSPDNCGNICDEYADKDSRIIVIHQKNGGLSSARNAGLDIAKGQYIAFIDSDDYVSDLYIYNMIREIKKASDISLVISSYYNVIVDDAGGETIEKSNSLEDNINNCDRSYIIYNRFGKMRIPFVLAWNKLYRREIFDKLRYEEGVVHEDEFILRSIMERCSSVAIINEPLTYHRVRAGSIMTSYSGVNVECNLRWMSTEIDYYRSKELYNPLHTLEHMMCHEYVSNAKYMDNELREKYRQSVKCAMIELINSKEVKLKTRVHYLFELIIVKLGL